MRTVALLEPTISTSAVTVAFGAVPAFAQTTGGPVTAGTPAATGTVVTPIVPSGTGTPNSANSKVPALVSA